MRASAAWFTLPLLLVALVTTPFVHHALSPQQVALASETHVVTLDAVAILCPPGFDNGHEDDVCITYGGAMPGPTLVTREDDVLSVTLTNRIAETVALLDVPQSVKDDLADAAISLHTHGVNVAAANDGVPPIEGTALIDSSVGPGDSFTYTLKTPYAGVWHYHDHVMGPDGSDGQHRGLYGSIVVLAPGEVATSDIVDLHLLDHGPHNGVGLDATVTAGERLDIAVVGLGNHWWTVTIEAPDGSLVADLALGPGVSKQVTIDASEEGTYTWTARTPFIGGAFTGTVIAQ